MSSRIGMSAGTGSAGLQARVDGQEEKRLQPPRSTTSAAEAILLLFLDAGLKARTTHARVTSYVMLSRR